MFASDVKPFFFFHFGNLFPFSRASPTKDTNATHTQARSTLQRPVIVLICILKEFRITYETKPLCLSLTRVNSWREAYPTCGQYHSMGSSPRLNTVTNLNLFLLPGYGHRRTSHLMIFVWYFAAVRKVVNILPSSHSKLACSEQGFPALVFLRVVTDDFPGRPQEVYVLLTGPAHSGRCTPELAAGIQEVP